MRPGRLDDIARGRHVGSGALVAIEALGDAGHTLVTAGADCRINVVEPRARAVLVVTPKDSESLRHPLCYL